MGGIHGCILLLHELLILQTEPAAETRSEKVMHEYTSTQKPSYFSVDLGMYPWQTFCNTSASIGEEKQDGFSRDRDKVFFVEEGGEGSREAIRSNCVAVKTSNCHKVEA